MKRTQSKQNLSTGAGATPAPAGKSGLLHGVLAGGLKGLFLGLLPMIWMLSPYGVERGLDSMAFVVPIVTVITGLIIGLLKAKRESK